MNADGTPDMQDVREGNASVTPDGSIIWNSDSNTVVVSAPPAKKDSTWMVLLLLAGVGIWLTAD